MNGNSVTDTAVKLELYKPEYEEVLNEFWLPDEQEMFTVLPKDKLSRNNDTSTPVVITSESEPVGFFVLEAGDRVKEYTNNPDSLLLIAFSIDFRHQGKGYAKKGLKLLSHFIIENFPHVTEVVLAVNQKNKAAYQLYTKTGFEDDGRTKMGKKGLQHILALSISSM